MESKILRKDVKIDMTVRLGTPPAPLIAQVRLLEGLQTRTFEVDGRQEHSLLAIAESRKIMQCGPCQSVVLGTPNASYELSPTCGVDGRQYIKVAKCSGIILDPQGNNTEIECTAEGNTKTIFVMD